MSLQSAPRSDPIPALQREGHTISAMRTAVHGRLNHVITTQTRFTSRKHRTVYNRVMRRLYPNRSASSVHQLYVHLMFVTKYRRRRLPQDTPTTDDPTGCLTTRRPELLVELEKSFAETCGELNARLIAARADDDTGDHVHLIVGYPPTLSIATLVNRLKGRSSHMLNRRSDSGGWPGRAFWTPSYFAKSVEAGAEYVVRPSEATDDAVATRRAGGLGKARKYTLEQGTNNPRYQIKRASRRTAHD